MNAPVDYIQVEQTFPQSNKDEITYYSSHFFQSNPQKKPGAEKKLSARNSNFEFRALCCVVEIKTLEAKVLHLRTSEFV